MEGSKTSENQNPEAESDYETRFDKSLQELKDLCSQLHYAADYCETTFLNAKQKKVVMESTREYICRAVVTVVDHLGSVSDNLDYQLSKNNAVSETELRIDCLNQRLNTCQQYSHKLALARQRCNMNLPRYHPRYISLPIPSLEKSNEVLSKSGSPIAARTSNKHEFEAEEEVPLFLYTYNHKPSLAKNSTMDIVAKEKDPSAASVLPVRDGLSMLPKVRNPSFHFECNRKHRRSSSLNWKAVRNNDILALIRRSKRTA
uniref:Protein ABIL5 n=1 Tax=Davidia involucrata TaxID=16924 RepID=A0A5B7CAH7_DAVIN